jgi:hypothetical protein
MHSFVFSPYNPEVKDDNGRKFLLGVYCAGVASPRDIVDVVTIDLPLEGVIVYHVVSIVERSGKGIVIGLVTAVMKAHEDFVLDSLRDTEN